MDLLEIEASSRVDHESNWDMEKGDTHVEDIRNHHRRAVVRIEVHDTGAGLRQKDVAEYVPSVSTTCWTPG